jgi:hypothetical protein
VVVYSVVSAARRTDERDIRRRLPPDRWTSER